MSPRAGTRSERDAAEARQERDGGGQIVRANYIDGYGSSGITALRRWLIPPEPFVLNPQENIDVPLGKYSLYIGGAGNVVDGYINLDLFGVTGVNVVGDAQKLPFPNGIFQRVECDAVLEHVENPAA